MEYNHWRKDTDDFNSKQHRSPENIEPRIARMGHPQTEDIDELSTRRHHLSPPDNSPSRSASFVDGPASSYEFLSSSGQSGLSSWKNQSSIGLTGIPPAGEVRIDHLRDRDDADYWNGWRRCLFRAAPFLILINMSLYIAYLVLRVIFIVSAEGAQHTVFYQAWVFVAIELAVSIPSLLHDTWTMWAMKKRTRAKLRLIGDRCPMVDVLITCCGEDDSIVLDTVRAACDVDYPSDRFRVVLLDDANSSTLKAAISDIAATHPNLYYSARPKYVGVPHHYKAGNLNHGLEFVDQMPEGPGEFVAALDADMIPEREWLRAMLPHMLLDPRLGLACPPQLFYNTPPSDPLSQSLDLFVHVIEPIKDALGVAWCTGSGYVVRRQPLDEIGRFPLGSLVEDVATSTLMLGKGWKTAYVHEPLQFGTVPEDFGGHLKQRSRWAVGTVDTSIKLNFCLWGDKVRGLTLAQRFSGFLYACLSLYTLPLTASLFAIPIVLAMGGQLVAYSNDNQLRWLIRICFATTLSSRLCELALSLPVGYHTCHRAARLQLWISPYIAFCIIRSFLLPKWLGGQDQVFKSTGSLSLTLDERDAATRKGMVRRLWGILISNMALFHLTFVYLTLVAVVVSSYRCYMQHSTVRGVLLCLVTHAFWPPLTFLLVCSSLWTPVSYAIDPPSMPAREKLLVRDQLTGVAHPTRQSKEIAFGAREVWTGLEYTISTVYTSLLFAATFIL